MAGAPSGTCEKSAKKGKISLAKADDRGQRYGSLLIHNLGFLAPMTKIGFHPYQSGGVFSLRSTGVALVAVAALLCGNASANAKKLTEAQALTNELTNLGTSLAQADSGKLLQAVKNAIATTPGLNLGILVGDALQGAGVNATNAGSVFGQAVANQQLQVADKVTFTAIVAQTAGKGKAANVLQVPDFAALAIPNDGSAGANFITAAVDSKSSAGAGAILGGRSEQLNGDTGLSVQLVTGALSNKKLAPYVQNIARYVGAEVNDSASFATQVSVTNTKIATKVLVGTTNGDPTNAGNILDTALSSATLLPTLDKAASSLGKSLAAVADIEEIQKIGHLIGEQISLGHVKLSVATPLVKSLVTAVLNKPSTNQFGQNVQRNLPPNKQDEIPEVAAYLISGFIGSPDLSKLSGSSAKAKKGAAAIFKILTSAAAVKPGKLTGVAQVSYASDLAASVAWTVEHATIGTGPGQLPQDIADAFKTLMLDPKTAAKITKDKTLNGQHAVAQAISDAYSTDPAVIALNELHFENGYSPAGAISDPETDIHPFGA